jgi:hypothetical protein
LADPELAGTGFAKTWEAKASTATVALRNRGNFMMVTILKGEA